MRSTYNVDRYRKAFCLNCIHAIDENYYFCGAMTQCYDEINHHLIKKCINMNAYEQM